jgi:hypothetical protein
LFGCIMEKFKGKLKSRKRSKGAVGRKLGSLKRRQKAYGPIFESLAYPMDKRSTMAEIR